MQYDWLDVLPLPHLLVDKQQRLLSCSAALEELLHGECGSLENLEQLWLQLCPDADYRQIITRQFDRQWSALCAGEPVEAVELTACAFDGIHQTLRFTLGRYRQHVLLCLQTLDSLPLEQLSLQVFLDNCNDALHVLDVKGNLRLFSRRFAAFLGYSHHILKSLNVVDWDVDMSAEHWQELMQQPLIVPLTVESRHRCENGQIRHVEVTVSRIRLDDGFYILASSHDITERKATQALLEARLRLSEKSYAFSLHQLLVATLDEAGDLTDSPIGFFHFLLPDQQTLTLQAWSTRTTAEYCHAEGVGRHYDVDDAGIWADSVRLRQAIICNDYAAAEKKGLPAGHAEVLRFISIPIFREGMIVAIIGVGNKATAYQPQDVSQVETLADLAWDLAVRKQAEDQLKASELRFYMAMEHTPIGIALISPEGKWLHVNPALCGIVGYSEEELIGHAVLEITHPDDHSATTHCFELALSDDGGSYALEKRYFHKHGQIVWVELNVALVRDPEGPPLYFIGQVQNITERHQAQWELRESRDRLKAAASAGIVGVWEWDLQTNLLNWDAVMCKLHGLPPDSRQNYYAFWCERIHPADEKLLRQQLLRVKQGAQEFNAEYRVVWQDDSEHFIKSAAHCIRNPQGELIKLIGMNYDLTEQRQTQQALLEAKNHAEQASRTKSDFLANMSHEIRTPMNAVMGLTQLLLDTELNTRQRDYLFKLNAASRSLLGILNDILDYSKIEAGKLSLENIVFELDEVLEHCANLFSFTAEEKGLELVFEVAPDIPAVLQGDPLRLKQIINNLLGNALKFTRQGYVRLALALADKKGQQVCLQLTVKDSGIGMSAAQIAHLFEAFEQADSSTSRQYGGSGLGLTICKRLLDMMGGEIQVNSQPGQGACFTVTLPLQVAANRDMPQLSELALMHVLLVEEQVVSAQVLVNMLEGWGCRVDWVNSAEQALSVVKRDGITDYQLYLVDWRLPGIDGRALIHRLRQLEQSRPDYNAQALMLMISAYADQELQAGFEGELDGVLNKPVLPSQLFNLLINKRDHLTSGGSASELQQAQQRLQQIHQAKVLLVEDNWTNQLIARDMLRKMGLQVTVANDGQQALDLTGEQHFDVVLMDLQMPHMDGLTACRLMRQQADCRQTPIIAMTAAAMLTDKQACLDAGMNDFVAKPIDLPSLVEVLLRWVASVVQPWSELQGQAFELPGFDLYHAAKRMGNDWQLLRQAVQHAGEYFTSAQQQLAQEQGKLKSSVLPRLLHTIKGLAESVGALALHTLAVRLETRAMDLTAEDIQQLTELLHQTATQITQLPPAVGYELANAGDLSMVLTQLLATFKRSGFVTPEQLEQLQQLLTEEMQPYYPVLKQYIEQFDYSMATQQIEQLAAKYGLSLEQ